MPSQAGFGRPAPRSGSKPQGEEPATDPDDRLPTLADTAWHSLDPDQSLSLLSSANSGLTDAEARRRLERYGPNRLRAAKQVSAWRILLDQLRSLVVLLLLAAATIAFLIGDAVEAIAVGAVLIINTLLGFTTELRARRAMQALLGYEVPHARVVRGGTPRTIEASELVIGDIIELEAGDAVPADARLLSAGELRANEAPLTGESFPVEKSSTAVLAAETPLAERTNLVFKGTTIAAGIGRAVVVATGMATELGRVGGLVDTIVDEEAPLEKRIDALGRRLVWITLVVAAVVAAMGAVRGLPLAVMIETGIALAIAAVPEGLPAVVTIALAVGLSRMARRHALVRKLPAVEALGSTTVVCTDKTGTLTAGEMMTTSLWVADREIEVTGAGYEPEGEFRENGVALNPDQDEVLGLALRTSVLASRSEAVRLPGGWTITGDPTDGALVVAGLKAGLERTSLVTEAPQVAELPFSSARRLVASFHREDQELVAYVKGAPANVLHLSGKWLSGHGERPLDKATRARLLEANEDLASRGLRVLGLAYGTVSDPTEQSLAQLTFIGFAGLMDPPAAGVRETIDRVHGAGIRTIMITGDQRRTAEAIARDLNVMPGGGDSLDGREMERLTEAELAERIDTVGVFSRVSPEDKLKIVAALQESGQVVAMLGDGVNDAAALKKADVGVAMGIRGTDVAKETADIVLQDDRFSTISAAVEEGRVIFDNIRKFIFYLFSCNLAEVLVLFASTVLGLPLPLLPLQILWLNLVTDTFPALALAMEPAEPDVMRRPPRDPRAAILSSGFIRSIVFFSGLISLSTMAAFLWGLWRPGGTLEMAITLSFMTLALAQLFHLGNARSEGPVLTPERVRANPYALGAVGLVLALQLLAVYWAPLASLLELRPLGLSEWAVVAPLSLAPAVVGQIARSLKRR